MIAAWLPQGAGQLLGRTARSCLRTAAGGVQAMRRMTTSVWWLFATVTPSNPKAGLRPSRHCSQV